MLEPREADLPALLLVLVVLPIVTYILLGKWNEVSKKQARISMLAQLAAEEAHSAEATVAATIITPVTRSPSTIGQHECAQCSAPATTRCSRCKSVRYCSGNCQIVHWRQVHKLECLQPNDNNSSQCADLTRVSDSFHQTENHDSVPESLPVEVLLQPPITCATNFSIAESSTGLTNDSKNLNRRDSHKQNKKKIKNEVGSNLSDVQECITSEPAVSFELIDALQRPKLVRNIDTASSAEIPIKQKVSCPAISVRGPPYKLQDHDGKLFIGKGNGISTSLNSEDSNLANHDILMGYWSSKSGFAYQGDFKSFTENVSDRGCTTPGRTYLSDISGSASQISTRISMEYAYSMIEGKGLIANESKVPQSDVSTYIPRESSNTPKSFNNKLPGQKKLPKLSKRDNTGHASNNLKKTVALFPYDEFVKFFQCEIMNISPRGLLNCGNSCYANAVLQCLTSTKPLIVYLLRRIHSKNCWERDWCLICELEQHVLMLREGGGDALCPSRILLHMKNISCHMGGGNQEDAHEFLRLLVASMQSVCLEGVGGEKDVHPRLQKTTFIQHTFGGSLRSKVKCLRCHHESERYENILDLTLEILGRVESLEDAFTQFTAPEDLDGENMYKCLRCATYVKARKQLSIHEAPNILTIVLKRFQTGKYGKINKCISFPDMLDMVPFMTGTGDSPPLYMLYGVVVHLDTLNASFSGHYVSYVKDMQGTWFRVDDTQVEPVPMSQVMSEGAYILFYSRSYPRPPRILCNAKTTNIEAPVSAKLFASKTQNFFRHEHANKPSNLSDDPVLCLSSNGWNVHRPEIGLVQRNYSDPNRTDNADSTSSDWSLFTSSDESSFTTESTRDSFSTVDYMETLNGDPVSSLFTSFSIPEYFNSTVPCRKFSPCRPETKFISEKNGFVLDSSLPPTLHLGNFVSKGRNSESVGAYMVESFPSGKSNCSMYAEYGSNPEDSMIQTCRSHRH